MDSEDLKNLCQSILDTLKFEEEVGKEVTYWRSKYLEESTEIITQMCMFSSHKLTYVTKVFMSMPSREFNRKSPIDNLTSIIESCDYP